jgi:hypothetical protein
MPRKHLCPDDKAVAAPHVIKPTAVYDVEQARAALGLAKGTLGREVRLGRLRVARRAGKTYILGRWLLAWLEAGEVRKPHAAPLNGRATSAPPEEAT